MSKLRLRPPSPAMVVACVALLVALGGTAYAVKKIGPGQIKKGAVKKNKLADEAVTTEKIADEAVTEPKLDDDAVSKQKLQPQSVGSAKIEGLAVTTGKLAGSAVTGAKVANGSLGLSKVAQLNVNAVSSDIGSVGGVECTLTNQIAVNGLQNVSMLLVIPRISGWNANFSLAGYWPASSTTIQLRLCNESAGVVDPDPFPIRVLGFN
jgi:hypothetical protein